MCPAVIFCKACQETGGGNAACGTSANVVRLLSPLTIPDAVLEEGLGLLGDTLKVVYGREATRAVA